MSKKRIRLSAKSKSITSAPAPVPRLALFGPPLLLEGEDATDYDVLLARICAAVKPRDIIDEMFVNDLVVLQWEVMRWRRLKLSVIRTRGLKALEEFLDPQVELCAEDLAEALRENLGEGQTENYTELADRWVRSEADAHAKVSALFAAVGLSTDNILNDVWGKKAEELAQSYARREPWAVEQVNERPKISTTSSASIA
jgi:hypothetical protein